VRGLVLFLRNKKDYDVLLFGLACTYFLQYIGSAVKIGRPGIGVSVGGARVG